MCTSVHQVYICEVLQTQRLKNIKRVVTVQIKLISSNFYCYCYCRSLLTILKLHKISTNVTHKLTELRRGVERAGLHRPVGSEQSAVIRLRAAVLKR